LGKSKSRLVFCEIDSETSVGLFHALNRKQQRLMHLSYPPGNRFNNGFYRRFEFICIGLESRRSSSIVLPLDSSTVRNQTLIMRIRTCGMNGRQSERVYEQISRHGRFLVIQKENPSHGKALLQDRPEKFRTQPGVYPDQCKKLLF
jgi:hypothetical protein